MTRLLEANAPPRMLATIGQPAPACRCCRRCTRKRPSCIGQVFITGCSGSGTHSVASTLQSISSREKKITHEGPRAGLAGLVSWPTRCLQRASILEYRKYGFREADIKPPMKGWATKQLNSKCMYQTVVQVVRHPLSFLSSNLAFGQCVECWSLVEQLSVPPIYLYTKKLRMAIRHNRKNLYKETGGRTWDVSTKDTLLQGFMQYVVRDPVLIIDRFCTVSQLIGWYPVRS